MNEILDNNQIKFSNRIVKLSKVDNAARLMAFISFTLGTLIFLMFSVTGKEDYLTYGLYYVGFAIIVNLGMLFLLLVKIITDKERRLIRFKSMGILLVNIPIAIAYFYMVIHLISNHNPFL